MKQRDHYYLLCFILMLFAIICSIGLTTSLNERGIKTQDPVIITASYIAVLLSISFILLTVYLVYHYFSYTKKKAAQSFSPPANRVYHINNQAITLCTLTPGKVEAFLQSEPGIRTYGHDDADALGLFVMCFPQYLNNQKGDKPCGSCGCSSAH